MIVKNFLKTLDSKIFDDFSIKVKTWDLYNGFRVWNHDDIEIQSAKVENVVIYNKFNDIEIQAKITR